MALGRAVGAFAEGAVRGLEARSRLDDAEQRRALAEKQAKRDETRFAWESADQEEKARRRELLKEAEVAYAAADKFLEEGDAEQPQAVATPAAAQPGMAQPAPRPAAIAAPGMPPADAAPAAPQAPRSNPFLTGAEKFRDPQGAMDKYYSMKESALRKLYTARGEYDKAEAVPEQMRKLRESKWSEKVGATLAAMAGNAPGARDAFAGVYHMVNDGYELDPKSGTFDPEKGWVGLERVNAEGKREKFDLSPQSAAVMAMKYKDPSEVVKFLFDRADKAKAQANDERRTGADERRARASEVEAGAKAGYYNTRSRVEGEQAKGSDIKAKVEALTKFFPNAGKELDIKDLVGKTPEEKAALKDSYAGDRVGLAAATRFSALNPSLDPRVIAGLSKQFATSKKLDGLKTDEETGRQYVTFGGVKVYTN